MTRCAASPRCGRFASTVYGDRAAIVAGNRPALHRLFLVLLDNALKFSRPGGEVILKVENRDSRVSVTIEDFGAGISESDLPHIFERFYRPIARVAAAGMAWGCLWRKASPGSTALPSRFTARRAPGPDFR